MALRCSSLGELTKSNAARFLVGFVSPNCGICGPLTTVFGRIAKSASSDISVLLIIDANLHDAREYVHAKGVDFLPYVADREFFTANVPGSPWAVVTDGSGKVIVSGGVNTLENVEEMLAQAEELIANPPVHTAPAEGQLINSVEVNEHVG